MSDSVLIISIIIALLIIIALTWRYLRRRRRRRRIKMAERPEQDLFADRYFDEPTPVAHNQTENLPHEAPLVDDVVETSLTEAIADTTESAPTKIPLQNELIIVIYVAAQQEPGFLGTDIFTVLEDLGLRYGDMRIFHHYGVGELKVKKPVFSIANMLEPGIFDPQQLADFSSPGLALFMRLPGPFGGRIALELMLNSAKKLAEVLEGIVQDENHTPLEPKKISVLRERIAHFEQRSIPLAMTKRFN
ncbi:cell division protein ZipA [Thioploca ingrica]|uniref:Cell division protein ZipA n=1 Tax=Thioploca ingrica TaxID=40754 RepID=A0A090ABG2_9GAMM|nr:cell division protein ZipA [Thioploca ingrica]